MLKNKIFEVRDRATFIPVLCTKMAPMDEHLDYEEFTELRREEKLLRRAGYGFDYPLVMLTMLTSPERTQYDPYKWGDRTLHNAHLYIADHFDEMKSGEVVDVEYVLGEVDRPKTPEV